MTTGMKTKGFTLDEIIISYALDKTVKTKGGNEEKINKAFYLILLDKISRIEDKKIPTAGVGFNSAKKLCLFYNPDFIKDLTLEEAQGVLEHELLHVTWRHLSRYKPSKCTSPEMKHLLNVGMDIAINQYIQECYTQGNKLSEIACTPEKFEFPRGKSADFYIEELKKNPKKLPPMPQTITIKIGQGQPDKDGEGGGQGDKGDQEVFGTHEMWDKAVDKDGNQVDAASEGIDVEVEEGQIVQEALQRAKERGVLPACIEKAMAVLLAEPKADWRRELKIFVNSVLSIKKRLSQKRVNRRFIEMDLILPGKRKARRPKLLLARDTSGSVCDDKTQQMFLQEMANISKHCDLIVVDCDAKIHQEYKVKKKDDFKKYVGGGGTAFEPVFERAKELGIDGILYLTDTYGSFPKVEDIGRYATHTIWVTFDQEKVDVPFGKHLNIDTSFAQSQREEV